MKVLENRIFVWMMGILAIWGVVSLLFLWQGQQRNPGFYIFNSLAHLPVAVGWLYLMFRKKSLEPRLNWFWTPLGLLMMTWVVLTVGFTEVSERGIAEGLLSVSETFWYGLAFGFLFAFYKLESANPLWYLMIFIAIFWNMWHFSILAQALGIDWVLRGPPSLASYFHAGKWWHDWGWFIADEIVDVSISVSAAYFIVRAIARKLSTERKTG